MKFLGGFVSAGLVVAGAAFANGGPIGASRIVGTGDIRFEETPEVELLSEDLLFTVDGQYVDVDVVYILENNGPARHVEFAFPVDFVSDNTDIEGFFDTEEAFPAEIESFTAFLGDGELMPGVFTTDTSEIVLDEYTYVMSTCWFTTSFELQGIDTLRVSYRYMPYFVDAAYSKSWMPMWDWRTVAYRLDPAGYWGDGTVDSFSWSIDLTGVEAAGDLYELPDGGSWIEPGVYGWSGSDVDFKAAEPISFRYGVWNIMSSDYTLEHRLGPEDVESITSSSTLASQGGISYSPMNLVDLDFSTAWCPGGSSGGAGSWIEIELEPCLVGEIYLVNGYMKNSESLSANSRIRSLRVAVECDDDNPFRTYGYCSDEDEVVELDDPEWTDVALDNFTGPAVRVFSMADMGAPADRIRIEVLDTYPGALYQDLCVSEIVIAGYDGEEIESWYSD